jgi:hypothetical protein
MRASKAVLKILSTAIGQGLLLRLVDESKISKSIALRAIKAVDS